MAKHYETLSAARGEVHFSWRCEDDGRWVRDSIWGRTSRSGSSVEKNLDHLVTRAFDSEEACREALRRAAKGWLHEHR